MFIGTATSLNAQAGGDPGVVVVRRATQVYQALSSFQANFTQHFEDRLVPMEDSKGVLYQEGKNHFAMRFTDPPHDAFVSDGTNFWVYTPSETPGQVLQYPLQNHPTYGTNLLGTFLDNAVDRYRISYVKAATIDGHQTDAVLMEPVSNDIGFRRATIWFDRETSLPRRLEIEEMRDHMRILQLSDLRTNISIPPSMFVCRTPMGTRIISQ